MHTKQLIINADQTAFVLAFQQNNGTPIVPDYLQRTEVWGCFQANQLIAGFIINRFAPLRYLEPFTADEGQQLLRQQQLTDVAEITGIWHQRNQSFTILQKAELYAQSILKAATWQSLRKNQAIMGGSFIDKVAKRQKTFLPNSLFSGPIHLHGTEVMAWIYYGRARMVVARLPMALAFLIVEEAGRWLRRKRGVLAKAIQVRVTRWHKSHSQKLQS